MAISETLLGTCRTLVAALPELTAFNTAFATFNATTGDSQQAAWLSLYGDNQAEMSLAYRLRRAIRDVVIANMTSDIDGLSRELAYRTLAAEVVREAARPQTAAEETAELLPLALANLAD